MTLLIVIDMQNDFVTGALGTAEAQAIVPHVNAKIAAADAVVYTLDTHGEDYLATQEGKRLPVPHCIRGTWGHALADGLTVRAEAGRIEKPTFGSTALGELVRSRFAAGNRPRGARRPVHGYLRHFERPAVQGLLPGASCFRGCGLLRGRDAREPPQCALCDAVLSDRRVKYCTRREVTARDEAVTGYFFGHFDGGV